MPASINIATVLSVESDGIKGLFVLDSSSGKVFRLPLEEAEPEISGRIATAVLGQMRKEMPSMPTEEMSEVLRAKQRVMEESRRIFKRSPL